MLGRMSMTEATVPEHGTGPAGRIRVEDVPGMLATSPLIHRCGAGGSALATPTQIGARRRASIGIGRGRHEIAHATRLLEPWPG